ncbi:MAG: 2-amino-4-hydroxy-6-hydroxymethyldihydropteridine diphosphokinase [Pseudarcicella sp.]|nr:2-amino-4-hydroxy-6-hydroxymethyldihydropteridine diphosphokinase [Pseudarcicella sp.]MBP6409763.1 2-amino-4-hydroxy-6-hydroxymethyldihydropteridine diphosphokinase [Pseudarcicella sp.]
MVANVYFSIGSNLGDTYTNLNTAIALLEERVGVLVKKSEYLVTKPWGKTDQNDFLNAALWFKTTLSPHEVLSVIQDIETQMGRIRQEKWGERLIDIDIVLMDDYVLNDTLLTIPHPFLHERLFVLMPLCQLNPDLIHPVLKVTLNQLLHNVQNA